jgi:succinylglutamic semialdehyde dehydrogenase
MTTTHASLAHEPADLVAGRWLPIPGDDIVSHNPAHPSQVVWQGGPQANHVDAAVAAARGALPAWSRTPLEDRARLLRRYAEIAKSRAEEVAALITDETGKALWETRGEAGAIGGKVEITLDSSPHAGLNRVSPFSFDLTDSRQGRCSFRPHGVMSVVGPFNFPAHLPNGHFVPALAMGNTVVFKPSDKTPAVGQILAEIMLEAIEAEGAPPGIFNLVQGGVEVSTKLTTHPDIDGILFTGSWGVGRRILEANLDNPGRIIALELGGNNPSVVMPDADLRQAAIEIARCAFITTGQRCTCTRRLVAHEAVADKLIAAIIEAAKSMRIADPRSESPVFCGPIISEQSRQAVLDAQARFADSGGEVLLQSRAVEEAGEGWFVSPGIVRVDKFTAGDTCDAGCDTEVFGPLLRVTTVKSLDEAIEQANATRYGLAASIFTRDHETAERFLAEARAGCVNVNAGTAGASSKLPFGGLGLSGNHRPAGSFSLDYCAYPVAQLLEDGPNATIAPGMSFDDNWID